MNSILTNSQALSALQSLSMTQQDMNITQAQVSTGLAVQTAADNAAYWAIGQQLTSDSGIITSANTALQQSQAIMNTANSAIASVITTIDLIQAQITSASNPGASFTDINSTLASLSNQLTQAVNGASFNGVNLLNGSQSSTTPLSFVSGYDGNAQGGSVSSINFQSLALTGGVNSTTASTSTLAAVTDPALISALENYSSTAVIGGVTGVTQISGAGTPSYTAGTPPTIVAGSQATVADGTVTILTVDAAGNQTSSVYTGYTGQASVTNGVVDPNATKATTNAAYSATNLAGASSWTVTTTTTDTLSPQGLLVKVGSEALQGTYDLTKLGGTSTANPLSTQVTSDNASDMLSAVNSALAAVKSYASSIGEAQNQMTAATTFNSALNTDYANGLSALVDADMNTASTRLQALQTQEQLGIQSLSIANQNSQLILKLFNG
jgi:flagellin